MPEPYIWPPNSGTPPFSTDNYLKPSSFMRYRKTHIRHCVDVVPTHAASKRLLLARRSINPMLGLPWVMGGTRPIGVPAALAAQKHFRADTKLDVDIRRLRPMGTHEYHWHAFDNMPPTHDVVETFGLTVSDEEAHYMLGNLNPREYLPGSLNLYGWPDLHGPEIHPALRKFYWQAFDVNGFA